MSRGKIKPTGKQIKMALIDLDQRPLDVARDMDVSVIYVRMILNERRQAIKMRRQIAAWIANEYKRQGREAPAWATKAR